MGIFLPTKKPPSGDLLVMWAFSIIVLFILVMNRLTLVAISRQVIGDFLFLCYYLLMPKAKTLQDFIKNKHDRYKLSDIPEVYIPNKVLEYARKISPMLDKENRGQKTNDGGTFKNIKGTVGQWAVHKYLKDEGWDHVFAKPYVKEQYGDNFDIKFGSELWEVKTRDWWKEQYYYNIRLLMGEHEKLAFEHEKKIDYYIFVTTTKDYRYAYILGGIFGHSLWSSLMDLEDDEREHMKYPTEGKIYSRQLTPIRQVILRS